MQNKYKSIQQKFILFLFLFFISFVLLLSMSLYIYNKLSNEYIQNNINFSIVYIDKILKNQAQNIYEKSFQLSKDNVVNITLSLNLPFYGKKRLKEILSTSTIEDINVLSLDNKIIFSTSKSKDISSYISKRDVEFAYLNSKIYLIAKVPIFSDSRKKIGFLITFSPLPSSSFLKEISYRDEFGLAVKWKNKIVVASSWLNIEELNSISSSNSNGFLMQKGYYIKPFEFSFYGADLDLFIVRKIDTFIERFKRYAFIAFISLLVLGAIFFLSIYFVNKKVIYPLNRLKTISKRLELGDKVDWSEEDKYFSLDELGELYQRFKYMVNALKKQTEKAKQANKLKDTFLANISHEIRTPLNAILGLTQILETRLKIPDNQRYLSLIKNSANNLILILNDLLDFSKLKAGSLKLKVDIHDLNIFLKNIAHTYQIQAENKGLDFKFNCELQEEVWFYFDKLRLGQVLTNLLSNAIKFTSQGKIEFLIKVIEKKEEMFKVYFSVKDTGIGISKEKQEEIFKPFVQENEGLNREYSGTGLGLAIASELVKKMGGERIYCKSELGKGTEFYFILPLKKAEPSPDADFIEKKQESLLPIDKLKYRILLADDSLDNRILMEEVFKVLGQDNFVILENGLEVIETLEKDKDFDVIFLDIEMLKINGLECASKIREKGIKTPIVMITGHVLEHIKEEAFKVGVDFFLTKPFNLKDLKSIFQQISSFKFQK